MKLDLHGVRHVEVPRKLDIFFWDAMRTGRTQVEIVTGVSTKMKEIVIDSCKEYKFDVNEMIYNPGSLIIKLF